MRDPATKEEWLDSLRAPVKHNPWWLDVLLGLGIFACTVFIIAGLSSCASPQSFDGLCALQPVASKDGILVARVHCEQPQ
ncbi:MAG TPA: hypothetical protein VFA81_06565 [Burkholderiales bacterium]|nr:hypothetical protein [Burkholderiales bacterium]